jgi:ribonuclease HI
MSVSENYLEVAALTEENRLPHSETKPLVLHFNEHLLERIRTVAETKGKDRKTLATEFIVERLREEEEREGLLAPPLRAVDGHKRTVEMYTDGGCRGNPGPGGWATEIYEGPKPQEIYGHEKNTTNQRMELQAAIEGLRCLKESSRVRLYSDSAYLLNAMNKGWLTNWEKNNWKKADKKPVKNADLWRQLLELARIHEVKWMKVKGHAGNPGNERCDVLVKLAMNRGRGK